MSSQKGGGLSINSSGGSRRSKRTVRLGDSSERSKGNTTPRKSSRHDALRELVGEIVSNMGYEGIPIVRIKGNKYLIGTEV